MYKYIAPNRLAGPKAEIEKILYELSDFLNNKYGLKSSIMVTGSVKRNLVTEEDEGHFDLDYNICFVKVPQEMRSNLQGLKGQVISALDKITNADYCYGQDSTSVITVERADEAYSLDLGILIRNKNGQFCRLVKDNKSGQYLLQEVALLYNTDMQEKYIQKHSGMKRVSDLYKKQKNEHPETDSFHLYLEVVNTVFNETGGQRMSRVSGNTHTKNQMNAYANQKNPNNSASKAAANNRANQMNPNNSAYWKSREKNSK